MEAGANKRLPALDALRGLAVVGMIFANATAAMLYDNHAVVFGQLIHEHWSGLHIADTVFPAFLTMVGVAIPFSLRSPARDGWRDRTSIRRIVARSVRLFVIGVVLSNLNWLAHAAHQDFRYLGVLQRIALAYAVCALLYVRVDRRVLVGVTLVALFGYWLLVLIPQPDGQLTDLAVRGLNWAAWFDRAALGLPHIYVHGPQGYDPEGLLGTLTAVAQCMIGVLIGSFLRVHPGRESAARLAIVGAALLGAGLVWSLAFPIVKDLWSSSFVLVTSGITILLLALLHQLLDGGTGVSARLLSFTHAFGLNAIAAYVLHELTASMLRWDLLLVPFGWALAHLPTRLAPVAALVPVILYIALLWAAMAYLLKRRWIIKV